jgi:sulfur transfer complex TusBCD TusB component (DsrH family)
MNKRYGKMILMIFFVINFPAISFADNEQKDNGSSWINVQYIECMKNRLPCECAKMIDAITFLSIDTNNKNENYKVMLNKYGQMEPYIYQIQKIKQNEYKIFNQNVKSTQVKLLIHNDTLHLISDSIRSKFIQSEVVKKYDTQHYYKDNVYLLNKALVARGYPQLEKIVGYAYDSLRCDCNPWIGNLNLLSIEGQGKHWILDIKSDSLYVKKVLNDENSDPDDTMLTEKMIEFKWIPIAVAPSPSVVVGKKLTIVITEDMIVDASFIIKVNKGEIKYDKPFFNMIGVEKCDKLIDYMVNNQLVIEPGKYVIFQSWSLDKIIENLHFKKLRH